MLSFEYFAYFRDEHFYQLALRQFGTMDRLRLDPPPDLRELLTLAAEDEDLASHGLQVDFVVEVSSLPVVVTLR